MQVGLISWKAQCSERTKEPDKHQGSYILPAAILFLALSSAQAAEWIVEGRVLGVSDGDTFTVLDDSKTQHKIRFAGTMPAPEKGQAFSERSKQNLSALVFQKRVEARCHKWDRYAA